MRRSIHGAGRSRSHDDRGPRKSFVASRCGAGPPGRPSPSLRCHPRNDFLILIVGDSHLDCRATADCPLYLTSPNAPRKRDLLGTVMLSVLAGHRRYAHVTALRCDPVNPPLLGMSKVVSEDSVRRNLEKIADEPGRVWLQNHLDYCTAPLLGEPWILDVDSTVKPLYGHQEGAKAGYNPRKPGRPSHSY